LKQCGVAFTFVFGSPFTVGSLIKAIQFLFGNLLKCSYRRSSESADRLIMDFKSLPGWLNEKFSITKGRKQK